jgi:hypothetical protein
MNDMVANAHSFLALEPLSSGPQGLINTTSGASAKAWADAVRRNDAVLSRHSNAKSEEQRRVLEAKGQTLATAQTVLDAQDRRGSAAPVSVTRISAASAEAISKGMSSMNLE